MFDTTAVSDSFGRAAAQYDAQAILQRNVRAASTLLAKNYFPQNALILDLGCGTGAFAKETKNLWRTLSLDLSPGMCRVARGLSVVANAEALPLADAGMDGAFSSLMLQWSNYPGRVFSELARVLKPGAHAVIATLADGTLDELRQSFLAADRFPHVSDFARAHDWLSLASDSGLAFTYARQAPLVEHYPDAIALMRALKDIGATNKHCTRKRGLMTPKQFSTVERAYERFRKPGGLPATWQVLYLVVRRP